MIRQILTATAVLLPNLSWADLPSKVEWITNNNEPLFASSDATFGGILRTHISSFPQTFRTVGPDGNGEFRVWLLDGQPQLLQRHPDTQKYIPDLATHWAFGKDKKTIYVKLNPDAKWSDGKLLKASDYIYMLTFYLSKDIVDPWYNTFYSEYFERITALDEHTLEIVFATEKDEAGLLYDIHRLKPRPEHFYTPTKDENNDGVDDNFVRRFNFKAEPTLGAYHVGKIKKGKSITMEHVGEDWWGYGNRYYKGRYNVEKIRIKVIRDSDIAFKHFQKGDLDIFYLGRPELWHEKSDSKPFKNGYIHKFWGYSEPEIGAGSFWLNTDKPLLDNIHIRTGIAYALDINGLNKNVLRGDFVRKPHGLGVGQGNFSNQKLKPLPFEPNKAIAEFEKAGFTTVGSDGIRLNDKKQRLSFAFTYSHQVVTPRLAYLKEQAKLAGLEIKMNLIDGSSAFKYALEKKHDVSFHSMGTAPQPQYWEYFHSANAGKVQNNNFTNFSTPELDLLIMNFRNALSTQDKERYSRQIQAVVHDATVVIPGLMAPYTREAYWRWMKYPEQPMQKKTQMLFTHGGLRDLGVYWIDNEIKKETKAAVKKDHSFGSKTVIDDKYKPN